MILVGYVRNRSIYGYDDSLDTGAQACLSRARLEEILILWKTTAERELAGGRASMWQIYQHDPTGFTGVVFDKKVPIRRVEELNPAADAKKAPKKKGQQGPFDIEQPLDMMEAYQESAQQF